MKTKIQSNIWKAYVLNFLIGLHFMSAVLVPFYTDWGKISFWQIMFLQSWFVLWVFILEVPTGAIADYFGRKISVVLGCGIAGFGFLFYTMKPDILVFLIGEFIIAAGISLISGADEALVYDTLKETGQENLSKKVLGRFNSLHIAGITVAAPIGGLIAKFWGLQYSMMLIALPCLIAMIIGLTLKEPKTERKTERKKYLQTAVEGIKYFCGHKILMRLAINGALISTLCFLVIWTYQVLLKQLKVDIAYFGFVHALMTGVEVVVMNNFGRLEKLFGSKGKYLAGNATICAAAFIFLGINSFSIPAIIGIIIIGAFGLSRFVLISNYMQKHIESENRATVLSTISMFRMMGMVVGDILVGVAVEWSLNWTLIIIGALILTISLIFKIEESHLIE